MDARRKQTGGRAPAPRPKTSVSLFEPTPPTTPTGPRGGLTPPPSPPKEAAELGPNAKRRHSQRGRVAKKIAVAPKPPSALARGLAAADWGAAARVKRVGVPGGAAVNFDDVTRLILSWRGTAFSAALCSASFYLHLGIFVVATVIQIKTDSVLPEGDFHLLRIAAIFGIVFYTNTALERFTARFHDFCLVNDAAASLSIAVAARKRSGNIFRVGIFLDFVRLTTRAPYAMGHTCGEPNEIELTATHRLFYRSFSGPAARAEA